MERSGGSTVKKLYHFAPIVVLSVFAIIFIILAETVFFVKRTLLDSEIYKSAMDQKAVSNAMYDELEKYFESLSSATGIPAEVFTEPLSEDELYTSSYMLLKDSLGYLSDSDAAKPETRYDLSKLEKSITDYIEKDAEERGITKDEDYKKLLKNTVDIAKKQVTSRLDIIMLQTLSNSKVGESVHKYSGWITPVFWTLVGLALLMIIGIVIIDRHHPRDFFYWAGVLIAVPAAVFYFPALYLHRTEYFSTFFITNEYIHRTVTGVFEIALKRIMTVQLILLIIGLVLIIAAQIIHVLFIRHLKKQWKKTHWQEDREPEDDDSSPAETVSEPAAVAADTDNAET